MICDRCRAGQMIQYSQAVGGKRTIVITGTRCERCGFILLDDDEGIWSSVGL